MTYIDYVRDEKGAPWVNVTLEQAREKCKELGGRLPYMREAYALRSLESSDSPNIDEWAEPNPGSKENVRGGSWSDYSNLRAAYRYYNEPGRRNNNIGFRVVRGME